MSWVSSQEPAGSHQAEFKLKKGSLLADHAIVGGGVHLKER